MKQKIGILTVAGILACSTISLADEMVSAQLDADKDGFISMEEAKAAPELMEQFATLDVNKDGKLDKEELALLSK